MMAPPQLGGEGAAVAKSPTSVTRSAGLRLDGDDLRDASGEGRLRGAPRARQRLARSASSAGWCATSCCWPPRPPRAQGGGNVRSSEAPIERWRRPHPPGTRRQRHLLRRRGRRRRHHRAPRSGRRASDQVLTVFLKRRLHPGAHLTWDTLGMRGTCSAGFTLQRHRRGRADPAGALRAHPRPEHGAGAHILWSSAWAGIAAAAVESAQAFCARRRARRAASCRRARPFHPAPRSLRMLRGALADRAATPTRATRTTRSARARSISSPRSTCSRSTPRSWRSRR